MDSGGRVLLARTEGGVYVASNCDNRVESSRHGVSAFLGLKWTEVLAPPDDSVSFFGIKLVHSGREWLENL
jgi:hypothetical protein